MEGAERDYNDLRILRRTSHENGAEEVIRLGSIYRTHQGMYNVRVKGHTGCEICGGLLWRCPEDS